MRTLYISIIIVLVFSISLYITPIQADNETGVVIQNIQTLPTATIIGHTLKINATLINNSTTPIFVEHGACEAPFSVTFDNHVAVRINNVTCTLQLIQQRLDPGTKITSTSPNLDLTYVAAENGTVNATVSFPYSIWNQTSQSHIKENISKPFSFTIYPKTRVPTLSTHDNQAIIDVALAIPDLQKWSNDWQFVSMGFMTAKNQPGNWQYATVNLKASSDSSLVPCKNGWDAMVTIDRTTMKVISAWYPTMESHNCDNYTTGGGPQSYGGFMTKINTPLKQFKSGISAKDVKCTSGLQLVIKTKDGSPACVTPSTAQKLAQRGWEMTNGLSFDNLDNPGKYGTLSGTVVLAGGPGSLSGPKSNYEVDVYAADGTTMVGKTFSDVNAHYSIQLLDGNYTVYVPDYPDKQTHFVSVFSGKNTIFNIAYGIGYK